MDAIELKYLIAFLGSLGLALVLTPLALRVAIRREVLDHPGDHKGHTSPVPYLGGVAMCGAFCVASVVGAWLWVDTNAGPVMDALIVVVALAFGLCVIGLMDDLWHLGPAIRVAFEIGAAAVLYWQGEGVALSVAGPVNVALTIVWVVGITNAFNLLDNMDGLSAGVAAIAAGSFFTIAALDGQFLVALLAAALIGCALGFLRHNFHPARIYMGDAGSLFLGFMLAYLGLKLRFETTTNVAVLIPVLVLTIPIVDTTLVTLCRIVNGRSPFSGGRDHISHRLVRLGASVRVAVGLIYLATIGTGVAALVVRDLSVRRAWIVAGGIAALAFLTSVGLAQVRVYDVTDDERSAKVTRLDERRRRKVAAPDTTVEAHEMD